MGMAQFVGIDISKRSLAVCRLSEGQKPERTVFKTDSEGLKRLTAWVQAVDHVALEAGSLAFHLARRLAAAGVKVSVLNPGKLYQIAKSMKKTDKIDAQALAWFVQRIPANELPVVEIPSEAEEDARRLSSEHTFHVEARTMYVNRMHSVFVHAGITDVTKRDLRKPGSRLEQAKRLPPKYQTEVLRLVELIDSEERALSAIGTEVQTVLGKSERLVRVYFSMPGIGHIAALVLLGYLGDGKRFSHAKQVPYYAGLVPRVDCSGDTNRYGSITKQGCRPMRAVMVPAAWALLRSKEGGSLKAKFDELAKRRGKGIAIVAIARKMLEYIHVMVSNDEPFRGATQGTIDRKVRHYRLNFMQAA